MHEVGPGGSQPGGKLAGIAFRRPRNLFGNVRRDAGAGEGGGGVDGNEDEVMALTQAADQLADEHFRAAVLVNGIFETERNLH